jgi:hypothetical protein
MKEIIQAKCQQFNATLKYNIKVAFDDNVYDYLDKKFKNTKKSNASARDIDHFINLEILPEIIKFKNKTVQISVNNDKLIFSEKTPANDEKSQ